MRRQFALVALVIALPTFAFPIASPPPDPPDQFVHEVDPWDGSDEADIDDIEGTTTYHYENLSERGQELFDAARVDGQHAVPVGEGASDFDYGNYTTTFVEYEDEVYEIFTHRRNNFPSADDMLLRFGALIIGVVLAAVGGYGWVNGEG